MPPRASPLHPVLVVQVAVEPAHPSDLAAVVRGLQLLNRADPFVEVGDGRKSGWLGVRVAVS